MRSGREKRLVVSTLVTALLGTAGLAWRHHAQVEAAHRDSALLGQLDQIALCDNTLAALDRNEPDKARLILHGRLEVALRHAAALSTLGSRLRLDGEHPLPNLTGSLERVADHARAQGRPEIADQAKRLLASLKAPGR